MQHENLTDCKTNLSMCFQPSLWFFICVCCFFLSLSFHHSSNLTSLRNSDFFRKQKLSATILIFNAPDKDSVGGGTGVQSSGNIFYLYMCVFIGRHKVKWKSNQQSRMQLLKEPLFVNTVSRHPDGKCTVRGRKDCSCCGFFICFLPEARAHLVKLMMSFSYCYSFRVL